MPSASSESTVASSIQTAGLIVPCHLVKFLDGLVDDGRHGFAMKFPPMASMTFARTSSIVSKIPVSAAIASSANSSIFGRVS
jgi:hypothetical protein